MKEIIYLDTDLMNSMLAQLDKGLITGFVLEQNMHESETEGQQSNRGKKANLGGQLTAGTGLLNLGKGSLNGSMELNGSESENYSKTILEGQKDILNKAFHDYALELLTQKLIEENLITEGEPFKEGDLYLGESTYRFYDFELLKKAINHEKMEEIILSELNKSGIKYEEAKKLIKKQKPNARERELMPIARMVVDAYKEAEPIIEIFKQLNTLSTFASNLLDGLTIIKTDNKIGLLKKKYLRESSEALSFRTDKSRKIKFLVRIIGKKEEVINGYNMPEINENDLDFIPNMMLDIILGSFKIIEKGDLIVTPISIYYE